MLQWMTLCICISVLLEVCFEGRFLKVGLLVWKIWAYILLLGIVNFLVEGLYIFAFLSVMYESVFFPIVSPTECSIVFKIFFQSLIDQKWHLAILSLWVSLNIFSLFEENFLYLFFFWEMSVHFFWHSKKLFIYLFILGCVESLLLHKGFL